MSFIGIDLGGTFIKGAILDVDSIRIRHTRRRPFPDFESGAAYERAVSPEKVLSAFRALLDELLSLEPECECLLLCGQMHALIFCDGQGNPKSEIITWQDQRTVLPFDDAGRSCFDLLGEVLRDWDLRTLGNEFRPGLPLTQLYCLKQKGKLPEGLYPACLMDFVAANLCKAVPVTDSTNAEAHGMFNVVDGAWDFRLIEKLGFGKLIWPEIKPHFTPVGTFAHQGREIPCYVAVGDQQCALLGSFLEEGELSLNIATGSQAGLLSNTCELGDYQTRPYFNGKFLKTITHVPAGRALNALIQLLTEMSGAHMDSDTIWEYIQSEVEKTDGTDLDVGITFYRGPFGSEGHISNMRESNMNVGNVFSAAFRGMAENYYRCALRLSPKREWDRVVFSGGLISKIPALQKVIMEKLGNAPYRINESKEDALMGLLVMALKVRNPGKSLRELSGLTRVSAKVSES